MKQFQTWEQKLPTAFTSDGTSKGIVTIGLTYGFYVGMKCTIRSLSQPAKIVQVKKFISRTQLLVGPDDGNINRYSAIDFYTVADGATIEAVEQPVEGVVNTVGSGDIWTTVLEYWPIGAVRTIGVDQAGDYYTPSNPFPVTVVDETVALYTPTIVNTIAPATPDTEFTITAPSSVRQFTIKVRDSASKFKLAYSAGASGIQYLSISRGATYTVENINISGLILYVQTSIPNVVIETAFWSSN